MSIITNNVNAEQTCTFLFLGDLHYRPPTYSTGKNIRAIAEDLKRKGYEIDFVCHVGDLIENQNGSKPISDEAGAKQWKYALEDVKKVFKVPFFMCLGNHDWYGDNSWFGGKNNIQKYFLPFVASQTGKSSNGKPFYAFRWGNSYFLFTNHEGFDTGWDIEQRKWLKKSLAYAEENPAIKHVFIFGHPVLWNLNYMRFNENHALLKIISGCKKVDAYFSGHTHLNNASVWRFRNGTGILQLNGCPHPSISDLTAVGETELILHPPPSRRGYTKGFGYLNSYYIVRAGVHKVNVVMEQIGKGKIWEFSWSRPGNIHEKLFLGKKLARELAEDELKDIVEARLHFFAWFPETILPAAKPLKVSFNNRELGVLPVNADAWAVNRHRSFLRVPNELIKLRNQISISNPNREQYAVRDCYLEVKLKDGRKVYSLLCPNVLIAGNWKNMYLNFGASHPNRGIMYSSLEVNIPEEIIKNYRLDENISFGLQFITRKKQEIK
ncbi:MAG: metallophosphoesterase [Victivallaceae bacterium]|nr:metallophosphoesterase [Victivallaceae bacterium]